MSTTQCYDPEYVITELGNALEKKGIECERRGWVLFNLTHLLSASCMRIFFPQSSFFYLHFLFVINFFLPKKFLIIISGFNTGRVTLVKTSTLLIIIIIGFLLLYSFNINQYVSFLFFFVFCLINFIRSKSLFHSKNHVLLRLNKFPVDF